MPAVPIWDFPTRFFHWTLAIAVTINLITGGEEGAWFVVHTASGYIIAALLVFRLIWGFVGSPRSRFSDFVSSGRTVRAYAKRLLHLDPPRHVGHNPLGGWMVLLMLIALAAAVVTGLFSGEEGEGAGILRPLIAGPSKEGLGEIHETLGNIIIALAIVHVLGVLVDWVLTKENLVAAMITGRKTLDDAAAVQEKPLVSGRKAWMPAALAAALGAVLFQQTDFGALASAGKDTHEGGEWDEHEEADKD